MKELTTAIGRSAATCSLLLLLLPALAAQGGSTGDAPPAFRNPPAPLSMAEEALGGEQGPFYPSSARTATGSPVPAAVFLDAQSCGRSGCHADVASQWAGSAHRHSSFDNPWFKKSFETMQQSVGVVPSKWCGGCHSPALLLSGAMDRPIAETAATPAAHAGVSCSACHAISTVRSAMGQADYELAVPPLHGLATADEPFLTEIHDFLVAVDPEAHRRAYMKPFMRGTSSAEYCAACHKSHVDVPLNGAGWFRDQNDYDQWQANSVSGYGARSFYFPKVQNCIDCHMPQVASHDAAATGGLVRSHRFATANTALPVVHGDRAQLAEVEKFLKGGHVTVDLFAMIEGSGAEARVVAPLDRVPATVERGGSTRIDVVVRTRTVGHFFPGGKQDTSDCWLELKAVDGQGRVVFWSGMADEGSPVDPGAHFYRTRLAGGDGTILDKGDGWRAQALVFLRRALPNAAEVVHFRLEVPPDAADSITLTARLNYRRFAWDYTQWVFAGTTAPKLPIVTMAEDTATLRVVDAGAARSPVTAEGGPANPKHPEHPEDAERWNDFGLGQFLQGNLRGASEAFRKVSELAPRSVDGWHNLAQAALAEGDVETARTALTTADTIAPDLPRTLVLWGQIEEGAGSHERSLEFLRKASAQKPQDRVVLTDIGRVLMLAGEYEEAAEAFERVLGIDPEDRGAHNNLMIAYRALGDREKSTYHQRASDRFRPLESSRILNGEYWQAHPHENNERQGVHEHRSVPLDQAGRAAPAPRAGDR